MWWMMLDGAASQTMSRRHHLVQVLLAYWTVLFACVEKNKKRIERDVYIDPLDVYTWLGVKQIEMGDDVIRVVR
jgi:hypothetical protein